MVQEENASYGFRRNLLAMKPIALVVLVACMGVNAVLLSSSQNESIGSLVVSAMMLVLLSVWLLAIRPKWVLEAAEDYAKSLFDALERLSTVKASS